MKKAVKTTIVSLTVCLLLVVPGWAQASRFDFSMSSGAYQRDKPPEKPKERPKDEKKGRDERPPEKKDDKGKKKPDFF